MIKFFRKIRHRLIAEGKFRSYLLYAIGEITLVVFGILIALWINNWNQEIKDKKTESAFLEYFCNDLKTDVQTLKDHMHSNTKRINNADSIILFLSTKDQLSESELTRFYHWNLSLAFESYFIPERSTIN